MRTRIECCRGCENRKQGCHAVCEEYIRENKELDELRHTIRAMWIINSNPFNTVEAQ